ncbi:MAG: hypothetical protein JWL73_994, partial [Actinomycetia bacterium]|nr:hypothetical protein [Actinomycetes bacterium]
NSPRFRVVATISITVVAALAVAVVFQSVLGGVGFAS